MLLVAVKCLSGITELISDATHEIIHQSKFIVDLRRLAYSSLK